MSLHSTYYLKQIASNTTTMADNVFSGDVNVTNSSLAVTNTALTHLDSCIDSKNNEVDVYVANTSVPISGAVTVTSGAINATCSGTDLTDIKDSIDHGFYSTELGDLNIQDLYQNSQSIDTHLGVLEGTISSNKINVNVSSGTVAVSSLPSVSGSVSVTGTPTVNVTQIGTNNISVDSGVKGTGCQRVVIATDDVLTKSISNLLFDFRFLSPNSDTLYTKMTKTLCKISSINVPITGSGNAQSIGPVGISSSALSIYTEQIIVDATTYTPIVVYPYNLVNYSLPWTGSTIACTGANDATLGSYARTVQLTYIDTSGVLQSVTHPLSNTATTYNIYRLLNFECNGFGALVYNEWTIYLKSSNARYIAWIHPGYNKAYFNHIVIPVNGYVMLDSVNMYVGTSQATMKIMLWKQTSTTAYTYSTIWQKYSATGASTHDLSYLPIIYGPTTYSEVWGIVVCGFSNGSITVVSTCELNAKVYAP